MRTTLTLDDDVAAALQRRREQRGTGLRREVNDLLRAGLAAEEGASTTEHSEPYELPTFDGGEQLIGDWATIKDILDEETVARATRHLR